MCNFILKKSSYKPGTSGVGGEADLVVGDDVDGAVGGVGRQVAQVERLVHHPLTAEGRVAVQQDGHGLLAVGVVAVELLGLRLPLHHRVDGFEVGGVGDQGQVDGLVGGVVDALVRHSQVVLHVTAALIT